MIKMEFSFKRYALIYGLAVLGSIGISLWVNLREMVINPDAICYLYSAAEIGKTGLQGAMHLCPQAIWPFYSALIYLVQQVFHGSFLDTAFGLDAAFSALSVISFMAIVHALSNRWQTVALAAFVILLSHEFNILRQDIIRDHGFWALYLISIGCLLWYFAKPNLLKGILWGGTILMATLFRIEGAIFLLSVPFIAWLMDGNAKTRSKHFLILNIPLLLVIGVMAAWLYVHPEFSIKQMGRVVEVRHQLIEGLKIVINQYQLLEDAVYTHIMNHNSMRDAGLVVLLLMVSWYLVNVLNNVSWIYSLLVVYAWFSKAGRFAPSSLKVLLAYLFTNIMITFGFFLQNHFLAKRYLMAFSLTLMIWVPFALQRLLDAKPLSYKLIARLTAVAIAVTAIGGLFHFGHSKNYIREAGNWLSNNVPSNAKLYTNDYQLMYYSRHFGSQIFQKLHEYNDVSVIANANWQQYDYLALQMSKGDKANMIMQEIHLVPLKVFVSNKGDHIYIYKIPHQEIVS